MYLGFCNGFTTFSVLGSVTSLAEALLNDGGVNASSCFIDAEGSAFRYRVDGGDPTTSVGHREDPSASVDGLSRITIVGTSNIQRLKLISEDGVVGTDFTITLAYGA